MKKFNLPPRHELYTDKYFLRANEIIKKDNLNPRVMYQVFIRKGPGIVAGIDEAVAMIDKYSPNFRKNGGRIWALREYDQYAPEEPLMHIEGRLQDLMELETIYLGAISQATTLINGGKNPNLELIEEKAKQIVELVDGRPVFYFGSRHWHYSWDKAISKAAFKGGFVNSSTDIGAKTIGKEGVGTIPHALVLAYGSTAKAAVAFDKYMNPSINRTVLIDTFNKEISDTLETAKALEDRLWGVRIDTCGENIPETGTPFNGKKHETGTGVTIEIAKNMREALDKAGRKKIVLSSGFGKLDKVKAFIEAEKKPGIKLFDTLGVGGLYEARFATSDIVKVDEKLFSKTGRGFKENPRMREV